MSNYTRKISAAPVNLVDSGSPNIGCFNDAIKNVKFCISGCAVITTAITWVPFSMLQDNH